VDLETGVACYNNMGSSLKTYYNYKWQLLIFNWYHPDKQHYISKNYLYMWIYLACVNNKKKCL